MVTVTASSGDGAPTDGVKRLESTGVRPTYIGLDIGETAPITGCALEDGSPTRPFVRSDRLAKIAQRADPWGESLPRRTAEGDDSPRDGSTRDSTTRRSRERDSLASLGFREYRESITFFAKDPNVNTNPYRT